MSHFAAITLTPRPQSPEHISAQIARLRSALARLSPCESIREVNPGIGEWLLCSGPESEVPEANRGPVTCLPIGKGFYDHTRGVRIAPTELAERFDAIGISCLSDLAPPAGGCLVREAGMGFTAFTDLYGLQHLFYCQDSDCAVVGSSGLLVAFAMGDLIDLPSFGVFGLLGHHLGEMCGFQNTRRLSAGSVVHLRGGTCHVERYAAPSKTLAQPARSTGALAGEGAEILRESTGACLSAFPDADIELSGGLDSRLILAAIPSSRRPELRAFTLGEAGGHDRVTAASIASHELMAQQVVDLSQLGAIPSAEILDLIKGASLKVGHCANPFGRGVLDWVNSQVEQRPRLSGQNGEYIRGFYYPGQPDAASVTPRRVESLARWRMWTNQGVDLSLLAQEFRSRIQSDCLEVLNRILGGYAAGWLASTDEFYLEERMGRWVGIDYSAVSLEREVLAPFFHPAFVNWARPIPPSCRRGSRLSAGILEVMDPYLSSLPLDGGLTVSDLAHPGLRVQLAGKTRFVTKVARRTLQRITGRGKAPYGAETLYGSLLHQYPTILDLIPRVRESSLLDPAALEEISSGQRRPDWKSLGFLLNLEWTFEFLESGGEDLLSPLPLFPSAIPAEDRLSEGRGDKS